jgi:uncharacterized membrane protein YeaQ/YmgE (transglycosylase-associated protein family)
VILANIDSSASESTLGLIGALCFGVVVGYITYRTLARTTDKAAITDLAAVIGAVGGGTALTLWGPSDGSLFGLYSIGLLVGMVLYLVLSLALRGKDTTGNVLGQDGPLSGG